MADPTPAPTPTPDPTPTPAPAPWYQGKLDAEFVGHAQNKGWKLDDPATLAVEALRAHREAEKFVGVPADQLLRLPKDAKDEAGWNSVWQRLGVPKDAKEYDFSGVKFADGSAIDEAFADRMRQASIANKIPKDAATAYVKSVAEFMEQQDKLEADQTASKIAEEKATLAKSWGPNAEFNKLTAMQGAKRLGVTPEDVQALEKQIGYARVMEMFRKVGAGTTEDTFVESRAGGESRTVESAQARLNELMADPAWGKRLTGGDAQARREFDALTMQIAAAA